MLAISARMVPDMILAWRELPSALHIRFSPFLSTATFGSAVREMVPSGPLTDIWPEATFTSTPFGTGMGKLPTRDMFSSLRDDAKHFAAHTRGARFAVGHHPVRSRKDRHAEPVHDLWQVIAPLVHAQAGL